MGAEDDLDVSIHRKDGENDRYTIPKVAIGAMGKLTLLDAQRLNCETL